MEFQPVTLTCDHELFLPERMTLDHVVGYERPQQEAVMHSINY